MTDGKRLRLRGRAYQLDTGEHAGQWTYFLILGEGHWEKTFHCEYAFPTKTDALSAMDAHVKHVIKSTNEVANWVDTATGVPLAEH